MNSYNSVTRVPSTCAALDITDLRLPAPRLLTSFSGLKHDRELDPVGDGHLLNSLQSRSQNPNVVINPRSIVMNVVQNSLGSSRAPDGGFHDVENFHNVVDRGIVSNIILDTLKLVCGEF